MCGVQLGETLRPNYVYRLQHSGAKTAPLLLLPPQPPPLLLHLRQGRRALGGRTWQGVASSPPSRARTPNSPACRGVHLPADFDLFPASSMGMSGKIGASGRYSSQFAAHLEHEVEVEDPAFIEDEYDETYPEALAMNGAEESEEGVEQRTNSETDVVEAEMESAPGADADAQPAIYVANAGASLFDSNSASARRVELSTLEEYRVFKAAVNAFVFSVLHLQTLPISHPAAPPPHVLEQSRPELEPPNWPPSVWRTRVALRREPRVLRLVCSASVSTDAPMQSASPSDRAEVGVRLLRGRARECLCMVRGGDGGGDHGEGYDDERMEARG
ncbi:hypothetical protein B0H11DRAFT_1912535 [Mycena galericulata]|nr:hypothetical protein B0H11DRAFT_1912535 [Mycena galericulata]